MSPIRSYRQMTGGQKNIVRLGALCVVALLVLGAVSLVLAFTAKSTADSTDANLHLTCPAFRDVATSVIPPATAPTKGTPTGIQIIGDLRIAYLAYCVPRYGPLPPVQNDQRLIDYLKSKTR